MSLTHRFAPNAPRSLSPGNMCEDEGLEIGSGWFVLDDFMGGEGDAVVAFFDAVRADCRRMAKEGIQGG